MVKVLPEPVTPMNTWWRLPGWRPPTRASIAWGWSPAGGNGLTSSKGTAISYGRGAGCRGRRVSTLAAALDRRVILGAAGADFQQTAAAHAACWPHAKTAMDPCV